MHPPKTEPKSANHQNKEDFSSVSFVSPSLFSIYLGCGKVEIWVVGFYIHGLYPIWIKIPRKQENPTFVGKINLMRCALPKNLAFLIFFKGRNSTQCFVTFFSGNKFWTFFHFNENYECTD